MTCSSTSLQDSGEEELLAKVFEADAICKEYTNCMDICRELFAKDNSLVNQCRELPITNVRKMKRIVLAMERGQWSSIQEDEMAVIVDFDPSLWWDNAEISKEGARNMLVWVAKEPEIGALLDKGGEVLKRAFGKIGVAYRDNSVIEGMKERIDFIDNRNFFELAAVSDNKEAFKNAHRLLKEECDKDDRVCLRNVYCSSCADIISGRLNSLNLGRDVDRDGALHKTECPQCF